RKRSLEHPLFCSLLLTDGPGATESTTRNAGCLGRPRGLRKRECDVDDGGDVLAERRRVVHAVVAHVGRVRARDLEDADVDAAQLAELAPEAATRTRARTCAS